MSDPVERFRKLTGRRRSRPDAARPAVPPREWALVAVLLLNILWLSFALGGVRLWGEATALALSVAALFLLPRWGKGEIPGLPSPVFRLLRLPLFWFGFGLYLWFFIQTWNHSWEWTLKPYGRPRLVSTDPRIPWLPAGFLTPLDETNPVRSMMYFSIPWLACSAAWAGLMTRRAVGFLLHGMAFCGVAFAFVALRQHFLGADRILGIFPTVPSRVGSDIPFWGTLINCNHGAFYLILANALCLGLFLSGWHRDQRQFRKGGGAWLLYLGLAVLVSFAVLMAQARGAIIFLILQWVLFVFICSVFLIRSFGLRGTAFPVAVVAILAGTIVTFIVNPEIYERQKEEWIGTAELVDNPELEARFIMSQIAADMIEDKPWFGHGAGSWPYVHLPYLTDYPDFKTVRPKRVKNPRTGRWEVRQSTLWFKEAHVDLLQYVVEWGVIGCLFPVMAILWLLWRAARAFRGWDAGGITILSGILVVWLGAGVEFHFRVALVLLVWCLAFTVIVKLSELQAR